MTDVSEVFEATTHNGPRCWYVKKVLEPERQEAKEYLEAVVAFMEEKKREPVYTVLAEKMKEFDVDVSDGSLKYHLRKRCSCER